MAISITNIERVNPNPCNHFRVTVNEDGTTRSTIISRDDLLAALDQFDGGYKRAILYGWIAYQVRQNNATINSLIGQTVVS